MKTTNQSRYSTKLPDGTCIDKWEKQVSYTKTYIVDQSHPMASDDNLGTEEMPFSTINKAAKTVNAGEQVLVKDGLYREWVRPRMGGNSPENMIRYAAYPNHKPVIRASKPIEEVWCLSNFNKENQKIKVFQVTLPMSFFDEWSPLMIENLEDSQFLGMGGHFTYYYENFRGKEPYTLKRALVFKDGERLMQVKNPQKLHEIENSYYVEESGRVIHLNLKGETDPNHAFIEVSHVPHCFMPSLPGLNYICLSGFIMEHAGNGFAYPMAGAISPNFGHHWIIENNTVRQCNGIGIDVGCQLNRINVDYHARGSSYLICNNIIEECGFGGIEGSLVENTIVEDNVIHDCCWHDTELYYENGGLKFLYNRNVLVKGNHFYNIEKANAVWLDWACENCRVTENFVHNIKSMFGGIFMEASRIPNIVDNNIIWDIEGNGIYQHDCDNLKVFNNFVGNCTEYGVKLWMNEGRNVIGSPSECKGNEVYNNLFYNTNGSVCSINEFNNAWGNYICTHCESEHTTKNEQNNLDVALFPKVDYEKKLYPATIEESVKLQDDSAQILYLTEEAVEIEFSAKLDIQNKTAEIKGEIKRQEDGSFTLIANSKSKTP